MSTTPSPSAMSPASAPRSWAPTSLARQAGKRTRSGRAGGDRTRRFTHRPSCSRTALGPRSRWKAAPRFHFLEATPAEALETAREAAEGQDVRIGGGPTVVRDFLAAGLVDHLHIVQVPIVLGRGVRLWDGLEALEEAYDVETVSSPSGVTHLTFTRKPDGGLPGTTQLGRLRALRPTDA